jgi:hypothetical protein
MIEDLLSSTVMGFGLNDAFSQQFITAIECEL